MKQFRSEEYIMRKGKPYLPALLPADLELGELGDCFDRSFIQALKNRKYRYVEGLAMVPMIFGGDGEWKLHAWLSDGTFAFDPTWHAKNKEGEEVVLPAAYIGIEMDVMKVAEFIKETEYKSVIANGARCPQIAEKLLPLT